MEVECLKSRKDRVISNAGDNKLFTKNSFSTNISILIISTRRLVYSVKSLTTLLNDELFVFAISNIILKTKPDNFKTQTVLERKFLNKSNLRTKEIM